MGPCVSRTLFQHWPIEDPSFDGFDGFVKTRDELQQRISELVSSL